jgi:hypothetical protein
MQNNKNEIKELKAEIKRLRRLLSVHTPTLEAMLKRRGFTIYKKEQSDDLLLPDKKYTARYYNKLKKYSFRLFLRDIIKNQDYIIPERVTRFATREVSVKYIDFLLITGIIERYRNGYRLINRPIKSFGKTLEWFAASLIKKDFQSTTSWSVIFKRRKIGGDYDLVAKIDSSLLYMEIKSSPPKQIHDREIKAYINRVEDMSPEISIFFVDTELRMFDKIVPMFEAEFKRRSGSEFSIERIEKELFHINNKIFIINSKHDISANIETVLNYYHNNSG